VRGWDCICRKCLHPRCPKSTLRAVSLSIFDGPLIFFPRSDGVDSEMLSRSSSAYQPLEQAAAAADEARASARGKGNKGKKIFGVANDEVELTSIAVISSGNPVTSGGAVKTTTAANNPYPPNVDNFKVCKSDEKTPWTNFHFLLCIGIVGFLVFWTLLLSRMYLPQEFQLFGGGGAAARAAAAAKEAADYNKETVSSSEASVDTG